LSQFYPLMSSCCLSIVFCLPTKLTHAHFCKTRSSAHTKLFSTMYTLVKRLSPSTSTFCSVYSHSPRPQPPPRVQNLCRSFVRDTPALRSFPVAFASDPLLFTSPMSRHFCPSSQRCPVLLLLFQPFLYPFCRCLPLYIYTLSHTLLCLVTECPHPR